MNARRRIAIVLPNLAGGGVERVRLLMAEHLLERGFDVDIVLAQRRGELLDDVPPACRVIDLNAGRLRTVPWRLRRYLLAERPDAVLAAMWPLTGLAGISLRLARLRARLIVSEHTDLHRATSIGPVERLLLRLLGPWLYGRADGIVAISHGVAASLAEVAKVHRDRIKVIYNPIRQSGGEPDRGDEDLLRWWRQGSLKLIAVGSLKPAKDYPTLLKAIGLLQQKVDARLIALGEGPERQSLDSQVESEGLGNSVEGLGNVITEALLAGCRVVSTDCPGPSELLAGGTYGWLVPVANAGLLAQAIVDAANAPHDPKPGIDWASQFTAERAANAYLKLLFP
jgi:glycosyltransferase involved in cell wall biosynthesis